MAIKYREEALPKVSTFPFDISHWAGVNKLDGGQHDYEMSDCENMSVDNYPYASPRKPRNKILAEEGIQRIYNVEGDKVYYIDKDGYLAYVENGEKVFALNNEGKVNITHCSCTNNYDKGTMFYPYIYYLDDENKIRKTSHHLKYSPYVDVESTHNDGTTVYGIEMNGVAQVENIDAKTFNIRVDFPETKELEFPENRDFNPVVDICVYLKNSSDKLKETKQISYIGADYNFSGEVVKADAREKTWTVSFENLEKGDYFEFYVSYSDANINYKEYFKKLFDFIISGKWYIEEELQGNPCVIPLDYGTVYNNRIVGVKGNEIRASALGDFTNFWEYADEAGNPSATGAYATNVGSAGDFTGICVYNNMIMLFKKDLVYEMYGSMPYTIMELCTTGCIDNDSICEIGGALYWASPKGIVRYSGGMPTVISHMVDIDTSGICKAGTDGRKYYVFDGKRLYVYDTYYQMWHIEKTGEVKVMYKDINTLYILCNDGIYKINEGNEAVEWEFETKDFTFGSPERKNLSKLWIRTEMERQSTLEVYVRQDGGEWERKAVKTAERDEMFDFKLRIKKCDSFAIKFKGKGKAKILDIHGKVTVGTSKHRSGASLNVYR